MKALLWPQRKQVMEEKAVTIYTIGYRQMNAAEQIERLVAQGYRLVDIRQRAGSRYKPAYNLRQLCQRFGTIYHRLRELGNLNYPHKPFVLAHQEAGIAKALRILRMEGVRGIILLCACARWQDCHRSLVADLLLDQLPEAVVIHLHEDGTQTVVHAQAA
jgi:uncharacterized protein (DUF488 family)